MATTYINPVFIPVSRRLSATSLESVITSFELWITSPAFLLTSLVYTWVVAYVVCRILKYFVGRRWEHRARRVIRELDTFEDDLDEVVTEVRALHAAPHAGPPVARPQLGQLRYRQHRAREMCVALADKAYFQYGHREVSDANKLITRKFMRDVLSEFKDLRTKDANIIIDGALLLSFLPSAELRRMEEISETRAYRSRANLRPTWTRWWFPFGRPLPGDQ